ncbi:MAG: hypothetical protein GTN80_08115 [Nitrososphaeria archaeon]|nr:hypothetical protein [Nitrososphaeria archaeon]NIN53026.1 hypothetical protein [Nitrososphaeria archaeon]NIQ33587.1 hypothetical protein [Nitrososphaeria archaeon]
MGEREKIDAFMKEARQAYEKLSKERGEGLIVFHDDADGVCSAAIVSQLLEELGMGYYMTCIEKVFPQALKLIDESRFDFLVFADLGSGIANKIPELIGGERNVYIFDHHDTKEVQDPRITHLNPELQGLSGEKMASGATVNYMVAQQMGEEALKLAWMAVIGSAEIPGSLGGFNWVALQDSLKVGDAARKVRGEKEKVYVNVFDKPKEFRYLNSKLTVLSSVGYYDDGPQEAVSACVFRDIGEIWPKIGELEKKRKMVFQSLRERIKEDGLYAVKNVQWFDAENIFHGMGTKVVGSFTSHLRYQTRVVHREKYILGFMDMENQFPGLGSIKEEMKKVSARVPPRLERLIETKWRQPVSALIEASAFHMGGYGDGHEVSGSAVIPKENKEEFLKTYNELASPRR